MYKFLSEKKGLVHQSVFQDYFSSHIFLFHFREITPRDFFFYPGFGFIRFQDMEAQNKACLVRHEIGGRWCDVKIPDSQERGGGGPREKDSAKMYKIFVRRIDNDISEQDLRGDLFLPPFPKPLNRSLEKNDNRSNPFHF